MKFLSSLRERVVRRSETVGKSEGAVLMDLPSSSFCFRSQDKLGDA